MAEIIKDIKGGRLRLSKTRLTELTGETTLGIKWYLPLKTLKRRLLEGRTEVGLGMHTASGIYGCALLDLSRNKIGCRYFTKRTMAKIIKAAKKARG